MACYHVKGELRATFDTHVEADNEDEALSELHYYGPPSEDMEIGSPIGIDRLEEVDESKCE